MANSTMLNVLSHSIFLSAAWALRTCSMVLFMRSVCPSDCGCHAEVALWWIPSAKQTSLKKWPVNLGSLSWMISTGKPCLLKTWSCINCAKPSAVRLISVLTRITILVHLSTTVRIESCPEVVSGSAVMRSTEMWVHGVSASSGGCNKPCVAVVPVLVVWHTWQFLTYSVTSWVMPRHVNNACTLWRVLSLPWCPAKSESWHSCRM